jgi:peptidoglycan/LPS O-acetylase OafA/YrhL
MNSTDAKSVAQLPASLRSGRIPSLDGVRAVAILLVLYSHADIPGHSAFVLAAIKGRCGFLGVQMFFVLSGFLITALLLRERERTGGVSRRAFYLRRALRILPAYAVYLAVVAVLPPMADTTLTGKDWFSALTYTVNFHSLPIPVAISHVWSLSVEEHFYLLWPMVFAAGSLASTRWTALGCMAFCLSFRCIGLLIQPDAGPWLDLWTFSRMDDIAVGCLLALATCDVRARQFLDGFAARLPLIVSATAILALSQVLGTRFAGSRILSPPAFAIVCGSSNTINSVCIALLLWSAITRPVGVIDRVLNCRVMIGIGAVSYSLYLWHVLFCDPEPGVINTFPLNLFLTFAVALLSYSLIEKRFLALKDRLGGGLPTPMLSHGWKRLPAGR